MLIANKKRRRTNVELTPINTEKKSNRKKQFIPPPSLPGELLQNILDARKEIENYKVPVDSIKILENEISNCQNKRWLYRKKLDIENELQNLKKEIELHSNGNKLFEFDKKMNPIMDHLQLALSERKKGGSRHLVENVEREIRKNLTKMNMPIHLQHAAVADICDDCGIPMQIIANDSLFGCPQCAKTRAICTNAAPLAESEYVPASAYSQKSRILEWLEFCQAKEYTDPSEDILQMIIKEMVDQRMTGLEEYADVIYRERLNGPFKDAENAIERLKEEIPDIKQKLLNIKANAVRSTMQTLSSVNQDDRIRKFYERSPKYAAYISGFWPLRFTPAQEERIRALYAYALPAYDKYRKTSQPNWPGGYAYFLRCLCVLLGWDEFINHFNVNAGPKNVHDREEIRRIIWTQDLDWEYVPSTPITPLLKNI